MTHYMKLNPQPFSMIAEGKKTIELRLWDEKRRQISAGDTLIFTNTANPNLSLQCTVKALHLFPDFTELYRELPLDKCGYLPEELPTAAPEDMEAYYSKEQQQKYGVVGIEITNVSAFPLAD
ncbi:MAG: ASCH domain-containing protein [Ruminococcaceae bacterium]|nr:ASCH domain-containing protein [Oscillospiraceae bacterium]